MLTALGLAGPVLALIRQPEVGWGSPQVWVPALGGVALLAAFVVHERRTPYPMLPLELFRRRNFAVGNLETLAMYGGLSVTFFFLVLFLQQVAGYTALEAGLATLPTTIVMFLLSKRAGPPGRPLRPAAVHGRRAAGGGGRAGAHARASTPTSTTSTDLLPALLLFSLGLSATVAPLTATVLADADESNAGIASGVNNAIARVAGLLGVAALGAVVAAQFSTHARRRASPGVPLTPGRARRAWRRRAARRSPRSTRR